MSKSRPALPRAGPQPKSFRGRHRKWTTFGTPRECCASDYNQLSASIRAGDAGWSCVACSLGARPPADGMLYMYNGPSAYMQAITPLYRGTIIGFIGETCTMSRLPLQADTPLYSFCALPP